MLKKVKCKNCGGEAEIEVSDPNEDLRNILCETCFKAPKEECDKRAKN